MCGIAGFVGQPDRSLVQAMAASLAHRGPDQDGFFESPQVSLAHKRLSIIDLSEAGRQPLRTPDGRFTVIYNGEIYNYRALRERYAKEGWTFRTGTDTECLLASAALHGLRDLNAFHGMFAFFLWDEQECCGYVARDRRGMKPLFVARVGERWAFASEIQALLPLKKTWTLSRDAVERFYAVGYVGGALTMYEGVDSLEPGVLWKVASQGGCVRVDAFGHVTEVFSGLADPASAAPVLQETVRHAVQRHLVSDRPVGIFLSGGLDSSVVLAAMREARGAETIKSFTTRFRHRTNDAKFNIDAELAKKTAAHFGCEHTEIEVTGEEVAAEAEKMAFHLGQPHGNYAIVAQNAAAARAKQAVAVVLTGDGGDELFGGYERYKAWRRFSLGERIPGALPLARAASGLRVAWRERWGDLLQAPDEAARWLTFHATPRAVRASYLSFPGGITDASALALWRETLASVTTTDPVARCLALDRLTWLRDDAFVRSDRLAMRHGLEARLPLVDDALFALATAVPTAWHVDAFRTKKWWRETFRDWCLPEVANAQKRGWIAPTAKWMRAELRTWTEELLEEAIHEQPWLQGDGVRKLFQDHLAARAYHLTDLWNIVSFQCWWRAYKSHIQL
jgi:asparagine synthase (glutamine-hydrolysing)